MMLVIVRHADAGDSEEFARTGKPDDLRPLSDKGRRQMRDASAGLRALVPHVDLVATSPLVRAEETAAIVAEAYPNAATETTATLRPDSAPGSFARWVRDHGDADTILVVGHEPHLGELATWLMTGSRESHLEFKKGGACLLQFDAQPEKAGGVLRWLMGPKQLAALS